MANNTKALPAMDVNISGTLRTQFMTTTVSELELLSIFSMLLDFDSFLLSKEKFSIFDFILFLLLWLLVAFLLQKEEMTLQLLIRYLF